MRRILFFFCMAIIMMSTVSAKVWTGSDWIDERYPQGAKWQEVYATLNPQIRIRSFEVNGTYESNGKTYKRVLLNGEFYRYIREDADALYYLTEYWNGSDYEDVEVKYWDFKWEVGETVDLSLNPKFPKVAHVTEITSCKGYDGKAYDLMISDNDDYGLEDKVMFMRSVGRVSEALIGIEDYPTNGFWCMTIKFERYGSVVYQVEDYEEWLKRAGVEGVKVDKPSNGNAPKGIFDIYGRKLPTAPTSGFYIENGEKKLAK